MKPKNSIIPNSIFPTKEVYITQTAVDMYCYAIEVEDGNDPYSDQNSAEGVLIFIPSAELDEITKENDD